MDIYKVPPADNTKLATMELAVETAWKKNPEPSMNKMLLEIQSLIERVKLDDKKIRKLEKMNGITWLGDEQKNLKWSRPTSVNAWEHPGPDRIPPDIQDDTEGEEGIPWERGQRTAATLYQDRGNWPIPINCADGGFKQQAYWQGREDGAREMEKEFHGK